MNLSKEELENLIVKKREEIKELSQHIDTLKEEIHQIEKENWLILKGHQVNNHKFKKMKQLFKKQPKKRGNRVQFQFHKLLGEI